MEHKFSENGFFQGLIETKNPVTVITTNGFHMHGTILAESDSMINMQRDSGESVVIYKHAISTIVYETSASGTCKKNLWDSPARGEFLPILLNPHLL